MKLEDIGFYAEKTPPDIFSGIEGLHNLPTNGKTGRDDIEVIGTKREHPELLEGK